MEKAKIIDRLGKAFPKEAIRQRVGGGGKKLDYVEGQTVIRRLNAEADNWSFEIVGTPTFVPWGSSKSGNEQMLMTVQGRLCIEDLGCRDGMGVQVLTVGTSEDLVKGAETDALKKAATKFNVGIDLYGGDYEKPAEPENPRLTLSRLLRKEGITTKEAANQKAEENYSTSLDNLTSEQIQEWILKLARNKPTPF